MTGPCRAQLARIGFGTSREHDPAEPLASALDLVLAERRAMGRRGALLLRSAIADDGAAGDERGPIGGGARIFNGERDRLRIGPSAFAVCQPEALKRSSWSSVTERLVGPSMEIWLSSNSTIRRPSLR